MKKALFISVIALSPLLLAVVPTAESERKAEAAEKTEQTETTEQAGQTGQAECKGSEHATESTEATAGTECKEGAELGPDGKPKKEETTEHASCGCGY